MNQQSQSSKLGKDEQSENWEENCKVLTERLANFEHEKKKIDIQLRNDLQFQRKRANQFEQKYKNAIKYKNQEQEFKRILTQLNETLRLKENQILQYIKADQEKKRKVTDLDNLNQQLNRANQQLREQLAQIQQGAISAILQKDNFISKLQEQLIQYENIDLIGLHAQIEEWKEKHRDLEEQSEAERHEVKGIIEMKEEEILEIRDKMDIQRERYEQKINLLEQDIISYQKHIEKINEQKTHEENIQQKYYILQEKQRKTEKKLQQFENAYKTQKQDLIEAIQKLETQLASKNELSEENKNNQNKIKQLQKQLKNKKKQVQDSKHTFEKMKTDYLKKITQLEQDKKKVQDSLDAKSSQLERMRLEIEQHNKVQLKTPEKKSQHTPDQDKEKQKQKQKQIDSSSLALELENLPIIVKTSSTRRESSEQSSAMIQKLRNHIKELEENIEQLSTKLADEMKEVQSLRSRLLSTSGSAGRSDGEAQLLVQIEDLNSYIKKVQHNLMITKLKYAEDENYWSGRQTWLKKEMEKIEVKAKKQRIQLIQRIDRMKKTNNVKDKKTDYYQSSLK